MITVRLPISELEKMIDKQKKETSNPYIFLQIPINNSIWIDTIQESNFLNTYTCEKEIEELPF